MLERTDPRFLQLCDQLWSVNKQTIDPLVRGDFARALSGTLPGQHSIPRESVNEIRQIGRLFLGESLHQQAAEPSSVAGADAMREQGYCLLPPLLDPDQVRVAKAYLDAQPIFDVARFNYQQALIDRPYMAIGERPATLHLGGHDIDAVLKTPGLLDAACDERILAIFHALWGCYPTISGIQAWRTYPGPVDLPAEHFHRDRDCFGFFKLFVYLDAVAESDGPHKFVRWSQSAERLTARYGLRGQELQSAFQGNCRHLGDEYVEKRFHDAVITFTGAGGTSFIETTYGLHKGERPASGERLIFSVTYTMLPLRYSNANERAYEFNRPFPVEEHLSTRPSARQQYALRLYAADNPATC